MTAGDRDEFSYGLGQGEWTPEGGCPEAGAAGPRAVPLERRGQLARAQPRGRTRLGSRIVPLERHGQALQLQQRKFHVTIPLLTSSSGYAILFNMPGYGERLQRPVPHPQSTESSVGLVAWVVWY